MSQRDLLIDLWFAGVECVRGMSATENALRVEKIPRIDRILAVGKAAYSMFQGASAFVESDTQCLVVTKYGHIPDSITRRKNLEIIESGHPVPDENSLMAGHKVKTFVESAESDETLLVLVSGGASSLVEVLPKSSQLSNLTSITEMLLSKGYDITEINSIRKQISEIKGGQLLRRYSGKSIFAFAISDVPNDDMAVIGSGIGSFDKVECLEDGLTPEIENLVVGYFEKEVFHQKPLSAEHCSAEYFGKIIASNKLARNAVAQQAKTHGLIVQLNEESLYDDVSVIAKRISETILKGEIGLYVWGGEPTVVLPPNPGRGGRNQHLALSLAKHIHGVSGIEIIVAGTDGSDGPTDAAGAIIDGSTFRSTADGETALRSANSGSFLQNIDALFQPGPTGTNVMDLVIAIKR